MDALTASRSSRSPSTSSARPRRLAGAVDGSRHSMSGVEQTVDTVGALVTPVPPSTRTGGKAVPFTSTG